MKCKEHYNIQYTRWKFAAFLLLCGTIADASASKNFTNLNKFGE